MKSKKFVFMFAVTFVACLLMTGIGFAKTVGIVMPTKSLERWNRDGEYLKQQFESRGYDVNIRYSDNKIDQQVKDIEGLIANNVDLLVIAPINGLALTQVLQDAEDEIPVIAYDRLIMNTKAVRYYVSFDNYKVGVLQGEFIKKMFDLDNADGKTFNIEFTAGDPADNNAPVFFAGAFDTLKPYIDKGILVVPSGQTEFQQVATKAWDSAVALERMQNILASHYADGRVLDIALCNNDSTALGVTKAITDDYAGDNKVIITGQDGDVANLANIIDGKQTMTVYKAVANEAVVTLDLGVAIMDGKEPGEELIKDSKWNFSCAFDTESYNNGKGFVKSYLLTPLIVTQENLQKELVDTGYYYMDGKYPKAK